MDQSGNLSEVSLFITRQFLAGVPLKDIHIKVLYIPLDFKFYFWKLFDGLPLLFHSAF